MDLAQQVEIWRAKAREGTLTADECLAAVATLRQGRMNAARPETDKAKEKQAIASVSFEDI